MGIVGIDAGYRAIFQGKIAPILRPHLLIGGGFGHMWETDYWWDELYHYNIPYFRFGGGVMFGRHRRFSNGIELSARLGYAIHSNADENPWGENYDHFFWCFEMLYILTF